jgi:hypothetical protein
MGKEGCKRPAAKGRREGGREARQREGGQRTMMT